MKKYKRLTSCLDGWIITKCNGCQHNELCSSGGIRYCSHAVAERLAELEDKIEEGTLVNVPYAIRQQLYCVFKNSKDVESVHVSLITIKRDGNIDLRLNHYHSDGSYCGCFKYDPKYHLLFHDKTEALKKLEELIKAEGK